MEPAVEEWQRRVPDADIEADWLLLQDLQTNIFNHCRAKPTPPSNVELGCFLS
jgi:hypothetical protein